MTIINLKQEDLDLVEFLKESNAIEGVYDDRSLVKALTAWEYLIAQDRITLEVILETHRILMRGHLRGKELGHLRRIPVYIGGKQALSHLVVPEYLEAWSRDMITTAAHPHLNWKQLHVDYERIHPFVDGNGRTGRMFMNWYRVKNGMPLLIIHEGVEQEEYYSWFR